MRIQPWIAGSYSILLSVAAVAQTPPAEIAPAAPGLVSPSSVIDAQLTFEQAIARIVERSTSVAERRAELGLVRATAIPVRLRFLPSISLEAQTKRFKEPLAFALSSRTYGVASQWNLFRFGADWLENLAADADILSREHRLSSSVLDVEVVAVQSLAQYFELLAVSEVQKRVEKMQSELLEIARARFKRGMLADQEVSKVAIDSENARSRLADALIALAEAQAQLEALLGTTDVQTVWPWKPLMLKLQEGSLIPWLQFNPDQRPDVLAARENVIAESRRQSAAWRRVLPSLDAQGAVGQYEIAQVPGGFQPGWSASLSLSWAIFDQLSNVSAARAQGQAREAAEARLEASLRAAKAEFDASFLSLQTALKSALLREKVVADARSVYQDNLRRFQAGRVDANELAVDLNRFLDAEVFAIRGWAQAHIELAQACRSVGRRVLDCLSASR